VMYREVAYCVSRATNIVDMRFMKKGLHDIGQKGMSEALQKEIDDVPKGEYDAVLMGYALCSMGIRGLTCGEVPMVIPRAHDCITLLMGSRTKYREYFDTYPATYYRSTGWLERGDAEIGPDGKPISITTQLGLNQDYEELVAKFGEENAEYIMETLGGWGGKTHYDRLAYIDMDIGDFPKHEEEAREEARENGWIFDKVVGDVGLLQRLVDGDWNTEEFLVVEPGHTIVPTYSESIIASSDGEKPTD